MALFRTSQICRLLKSTRLIKNIRLCSFEAKRGLVLGAFKEKGCDTLTLTPTADAYNEKTCGKLLEALRLTDVPLEKGQHLVFWGLDDDYNSVAVVGAGSQILGYNEMEDLHEGKEAIRIAANVGCNVLTDYGMTSIDVDDMCDATSAAEGAILGTWVFNEYKADRKMPPLICPYPPCESPEWENGVVKANAQNRARYLMDMPANLMTPSVFSIKAEELLGEQCIDVKIYDKQWIECAKMEGFLSVTNGSEEEPRFLELIYKGKPCGKPIVLIGKGVTFDAGGISLKPSARMDEMRADMGGAATVVATMYAASVLKLPVNIVGLIPLCENMPSGKATKPGDVITMMNGKTVCVDNTDAEGRMILADAITYSKKFKPEFILDIATLTGAMAVALGYEATGVFTNCNKLWEELRSAACITGDRVWRFPLWTSYTKRLTKSRAYDLCNIAKSGGGGACTAAAFLREFVPEKTKWIHMDMAGVMGPSSGIKYLKEGMTGRPTRTLIQFIEQLSC